jgi:hypothetical protein
VEFRLQRGVEDYWRAVFDRDLSLTADTESRLLPVHRELQVTCSRVIASFGEAFRYSAAHSGSSSRSPALPLNPLPFPRDQDQDDRDFSSVDVNSLNIPVVTLSESDEEASASRGTYDPPSPLPGTRPISPW